MLASTYLLSALYFNATVDKFELFGKEVGYNVGVFSFKSAMLVSAPGYQPAFIADVVDGKNYVKGDPKTLIDRPSFRGTVKPRDGSTPFEMEIHGIQVGNSEAMSITIDAPAQGRKMPYGELYRVLTPSFTGGDEKFAPLRESVFVGAEALSDGQTAGEFVFGIEISTVAVRKTHRTVG